MAQFNNTRELIEAWPHLDPKVRAALLSVVSTRGKYKGYILSSAPSPSKDRDRYNAWQAVISELAPVRVSVWGLICQTDEQREFFNLVEESLQGQLGLALRVYEPALRWSLFAHRYDVNKLRESFHAAVLKSNERCA